MKMIINIKVIDYKVIKGAKAMSIKYLNWAWGQNLDTPLQKLILVKLGDNADDKGRAFPAIDTIAKFTSCNEKTVRRNVDSLEKLNLLTVYKKPARGGHLRNEYQLHYEIVLHFDAEKLPDTESTGGQRVHQLPVTKSTGYRTESPLNHQSLTPSINHQVLNSVIDADFELFWSAGLPKVNKKKAEAAFKLKSKTFNEFPYGFAKTLASDIKARINNNQFGFSKMHPTTYLNGERWSDEAIKDKPVNQVVDFADTGWSTGMFDHNRLEE